MGRKDLVLIAGSACMLILAFPPFPLGFLSYVALIPLFLFIKTQKPFWAFSGGYLAGFIWTLGTLYWIGWATVGGFFGVLLVMPFYYGLFMFCQAWLYGRWGEKTFWTAPFIWCGIEAVISLGQLGFPWNLLGNTQSYYPVLIQYASITGVFGVSFWVVLMNVLLYYGITRRSSGGKSIVYFLAAVLSIPILLFYGLFVLSRSHNGKEAMIKVGLVQGNIDAYQKWTPDFIDSNFAIYGRLTLQAAQQKPDLIVWPETATPCYLRHRHAYLQWIRSLVDSISVPLLTGTPDYEWVQSERANSYNAAFLFTPGSEDLQIYYKKQLVPFSERVPFRETFPWVYNWLNRFIPDVGDYSAGHSTKIFSLPSAQSDTQFFSVGICFESIFPRLISQFVKKGAGFVVVMTNDGWFGNTSGPYQHARIAVLRAIENRIWIARCANTGISEFVDPYGRVVQKTRLNEGAVLIDSIQPSYRNTFYSRHASEWYGLWFAANGLIFLLILLSPRTGHKKKLR